MIKRVLILSGFAASIVLISLVFRGQTMAQLNRNLSILSDAQRQLFDEVTSTEAATSLPPPTVEVVPAPGVAVSTTPAAAAVPAPPVEVIVSTSAEAVYGVALPTTTVQEQAGREFLQYLDQNNYLFYSKDRWNKMRDEKEGYVPPPPEPPVVITSSITRPAPPPLPPGLSVELPYESQLFISGRKLIGVSLKSTIYDSPDPFKRVNSSSFDMNQELQVRIKGRVGKKINVNVDFDDTSADKRDISVVYKGDPDEVVQEAAFGDIAMSLPSTEFVGYSRQLFGVKLDTKFKNLRTQGFFSRTKGFSEVKRFTGNTTFVRQVIPDTSYIPLKYYLVRFGADTIVNGSVRVFVDDRNPNNNNITTSTQTAVSVPPAPPLAVPYTGDFDQLVAGQDYTIDYERGIIVFRNRVGLNYVVAVDYVLSDGTSLHDRLGGALGIIKDERNTAGISTELKTFYSLGNVKIIRDNGRGNFILKVMDLNDREPGSIQPDGKPVPQYPQSISVDFESGIFNFEPPTGQPFANSVYSIGTHSYNILSEYRYRIKFVSLRPGIVPKSERVTMDGTVLRADTDYFIDYDAGIVTFFNEEKINENTVIEVSYDYAPFGGGGGSTLVGLRSELSLTKDAFIGSSFIYDFAAKTMAVPDVRSTPQSLLVWEGDTRVQNVKVPGLPLTMSVAGEYALSQRNPNIMNKAILESMEGIQQEDSASVNPDNWTLASNPDSARFFSSAISWRNEQFPRKEINPNIQLNPDEQQQVLSVNYDFSRSTEVSIGQSLSNIGLDFSQKLYLELWMYGDGKGEEISFNYGTFNENVDGENMTNIPKTEDLNHDGTLNAGEDVGWAYVNPDGTTTRIGAGNGRIDSEDFDNNGILNGFDIPALPGPYGAGFGKSMTDSQNITHASVDWTKWRYFKIPLNITTPEDWKAIKQLRITVRGAPGQSGTIKFASISVVSNKWLTQAGGVAGSTIAVAAINNENDPDYAHNSLINNPDYQSLYDLQTIDLSSRREQALSLKYDIVGSTGDQVSAREIYGRAYDLSNYKALRFFVFGRSAAGATPVFFLQAGSEASYFEYSIPVTWTGWKLLTVFQRDINNDRKPEIWAVNANGDMTGIDGSRTRIVGTPSFLTISQLKLGVRTGGSGSGEVWVNEIHMADSFVRSGDAWRANADFTVPGWSTFGMRRKQVDRNFETFSAGVYNRDSLDDSAYFNFNKLTQLPISTKFERVRTVTPSVLQTQNELVSILDEGRVISYSGSGSTSLNLGRLLPQLGGTYTRTITDSQQIQRLEDRETATGTMNYENPVRFALFPTGLTGNYSITNSFFRVYPSTKIVDSDSFLGVDTFSDYLKLQNYHTLEVTESWGGKTPFQFWPGFTLTPSYNLATVSEKNRDIMKEYPKSLGQDVGATSALKIFSWFQPTMNYSISSKESYNLVYGSTTLATNLPSVLSPGQSKYIERISNGELQWNLQVKDLVKNRYVQSLGISSSYRIQDSDSYDNVPSTYNILGLDKLFIRNAPLSTNTTGSFFLRSLVKRDDIRLSGRYNPFEAFDLSGRLAPVKSLSANFTFTKSQEDSNILSNRRLTTTDIWPDLIFGINQFERVFGAERWVTDSQVNLRHQFKTTKTEKVSLSNAASYGADFRFNLVRKLDMNVTYNANFSNDHDLIRRVLTGEGATSAVATQGGMNFGPWRVTLRYERSDNKAKDGTGRFTNDLLTNTYTGQLYSDQSFPRGLPLPFTRRTLPLTNRLIINSTLKYADQSSSINVESNNTNTYGLSGTAEYEVSQNFRLSVGIGYSRVMNRVRSEYNYSTIEASSRLTIQF